ncbi:MAG: SDR family NAD(P)-dependent oxidoreductase [Candidatus Kapabacteria bacterium]|jgi:dihydroflavonol-4-reductase|nr:SDR family NAD(P)-dependent oxidoreductase [Candidatus Kapabacteria bacterium]
MKIFLTGGTGFIGQHIAKALLQRGWSVQALVRTTNSPQAHYLRHLGAEIVPGDILNPASMRPSIEKADVVLHNAGWYEYGVTKQEARKMATVNVQGTKNVLELAHQCGNKKTLYVSSVLAFGDSGRVTRDETFRRQSEFRSVYEQSKTDGHSVAEGFRQRGLPLIIACPNAVIGVNDHSAWGYFQRMYVNGIMPPLAWSPDVLFGCVSVEDVAEGIALAIEKEQYGEMYHFNGEIRTFREILSEWKHQKGGFAPRVWLPTTLAALTFAPMAPLLRMMGLPAFISRETVIASGSLNFAYSSDKAKRELGWKPVSAGELWSKTFAAEQELLTARKRQKQNILQRLKPFVE